jgi:hypothetical protein
MQKSTEVQNMPHFLIARVPDQVPFTKETQSNFPNYMYTDFNKNKATAGAGFVPRPVPTFNLERTCLMSCLAFVFTPN